MNFRHLAAKTFLICLGLAGIALTRPANAGTFNPIRMHAGGGAYTDSLGQTWSADTGFSGGSVYSTTRSVNNTPDPALYETVRDGAFSYQFAVPNGSYTVVLKFAEIYWNSAGQRAFNVSINGTQVLTNFDIVAEAGAPLTAIDKTFPITVSNGTISIQFIPGSVNLPNVSAVELLQSSGSTQTSSASTLVRVHSGGGAYADSLGQTWSADTGFSGGSVYSTTKSVNNTPDPALYETVRYGAFSYQFTVPNGGYTVVLKFAEIYWNSAGQRAFNVSINGTQVLTNFDIVAEAGAPLTAIDKTFPITVSNGTISIQFIPGSVNLPNVSAINLVPSPSTATVTATPQGQLSLSQTSFAFGNVNIGASASQTFTVGNTGTAAIILSSVSISGAGFNATGASSGVTLNPGQSTTLTATFTPATAAAVTGTVAFTSNAANASATIALSGTGVQQPPVAHSAALLWDPSASSGVIGYYVYRGANSAGPFTLLNSLPISTASYTDTAIQAGQTYFYAVTSVDSSHSQSAYSNIASVTVP